MHNKTSYRANARSWHSPDLFTKPIHIAIMIGLTLIGLLLGYILAFISFDKWHRRKKRSRKFKRGSYQSSQERTAASTVDNGCYFYSIPQSASLYGAPDTYLTEDERKRLGMGKVKRHASVQTEQQTEPPKYENVVADGLYDYTMTYIVHQNIMSTTLNSRRGAICNESRCKKSPMYERPKKTPPQIRHDVMKFHEKNFDTEDTDEFNYVDPNSINPKKDRTSKPKHSVCQCSSDSESEKEEVNNELVEYAKSLRLKKMALKKEKLEYMSMTEIPSDPKSSKPDSSEPKSPKLTRQKVLEPKSAKKQCSLRKKTTKSNSSKNGHVMVELTPELWDILKSHTAKRRAAKNSRSSSKLRVIGKENNCSSKTGSEDDGPYCKMSKLSSRGDTSTDDGDMDYIDVIM